MRKVDFQKLRDGNQSVQKGLGQLRGLFYGINAAVMDAADRSDPTESLGYIMALAELGSDHADVHCERASELYDLIDEVDQPVVDMMQSARQASSIQDALSALAQVLPEDQTDAHGLIKVVLKLSHDLSMHLASGGRYKYVLAEALKDVEDNE